MVVFPVRGTVLLTVTMWLLGHGQNEVPYVFVHCNLWIRNAEHRLFFLLSLFYFIFLCFRVVRLNTPSACLLHVCFAGSTVCDAPGCGVV